MNLISLKQELTAAIKNRNSESFLKEQLYGYKSIFSNKVFPDNTKPRFFPAKIISNEHAYMFSSRQISKRQLIDNYCANGKVLIGKSRTINCCKYNFGEWKNANFLLHLN
ncbi:hypothetical protein ALT761_03338 [Alteromonas sp. 76-1]|nr:hypothetical protein ALT761_03338 [Alteromonas sp. 76-1]